MEALHDAGIDPDSGRFGTKRCTEVVIEGWPEVGALPKMVSGALAAG